MIPAETTEPLREKRWRRFAAPFTRSPAFRYLWLGHLISFFGSSITLVILPVLVYSLTGSSTRMGIVMAVYMLPNVLILPVAGHLVDRYDRIRIMMLADILRCAVMGATSVLALTGVLGIPLLLVLVGLYGLMDGLFQPAYSAVRASVFTPEIRVAANSVSQISMQGIRLIGPSAGGLLISHWSAGFGFGLDALTYLASLLFLFYLRSALVRQLPALAAHSSAAAETALAVPADRETANGTAAGTETAGTADWKADFREGIAVLRSHPWLWVTIIVFAFVNICFTGITTVLLPWLFKVHHGWQPYIYGFAVTGAGCGAIAGGLLVGSGAGRRHRGVMAYGGAILSGLALLALPLAPGPEAAIALFAAEGFGMMIFGLIWEISLQELVPQEVFGRVASLDMMGSFALLPFGLVAIGWLADGIGGVVAIAIFAALGIAALASALALPAIRRFR